MSKDCSEFGVVSGEHATALLVITTNIDAHLAVLGLNSQAHTGEHIAAKFDFKPCVAVLVDADEDLTSKGFKQRLWNAWSTRSAGFAFGARTGRTDTLDGCGGGCCSSKTGDGFSLSIDDMQLNDSDRAEAKESKFW